MLEFNDIKCKEFKQQSTSMQFLHMFQDAVRMLNGIIVRTENDVVGQTCELSDNRFTIRCRVKSFENVSFPVYWFTAQAAAYRAIRSNTCSRVEVVPSVGHHVEINYCLWIDSPLPF